MAENFQFHAAWKEFFNTTLDALEQERQWPLTRTTAINVVKKILKFEKEKLNEVLREFSIKHGEEEGVGIKSNDLLNYLGEELIEVANTVRTPRNLFTKIRTWLFGNASVFEALSIALESLKELLESLPQWIKNAMTLLNETFKLLKSRSGK